MAPRIQYWSNAADEAGPTEMTIDPQGRAALTVLTNRDDPARTSAGLFRVALPASRIDPLASALRSEGFRAVPEPGAVLSGEVVRRLTLADAGGVTTTRTVAGTGDPPAAFAQAESLALDIVAEVRRHGVCALSLESASLPARWQAARPVSFTLKLRNAGSGELRLVHPRHGSPETQVEIAAVRNDIPLADLRHTHQVFATLPGTSLARSGSAQDRHLVLPAGASADLPVDTLLDWPPGSYDVQIVLHASLLDRSGASQVAVELLTPKLKAVVEPSR